MARHRREERRPEDEAEEESQVGEPALSRLGQPGNEPADAGDAAVDEEERRGGEADQQPAREGRKVSVHAG